MSSNGYAPALWLECGAIRWLQVVYLLFALLSLYSLWLLPWPWWAALFATVPLLLLLWRTWGRRGELGGESVLLHWDEDGQWWQLPNREPLVLARESLLSPALTILRLRPLARQAPVLACLLTPQTLGEENYRRLVLRLREQARREALSAQAGTQS